MNPVEWSDVYYFVEVFTTHWHALDYAFDHKEEAVEVAEKLKKARVTEKHVYCKVVWPN